MTEKRKGSRTEPWVILTIKWLTEEVNPGQGTEKGCPESLEN